MLDSFSTREVMELTGVSARQLQWWDEQRLVVPARRARQRVYSAADLAEITVIDELRRRRVSLKHVRHVMRFLRHELQARLADMLVADPWSAGSLREKQTEHLLFDGRHVYLKKGPEQVVDLMRNSRQPMLLLSLSDALRPLRADIEGMVAARGRKSPAKTNYTKGGKRKQA